MSDIDSDWFYEKLKEKGSSSSELARFLRLDPSSVSRMLRGERKMSAEEQDQIAGYLGVPLLEVVARRRRAALGFAEEGQAVFVTEQSQSERRRRSETQLQSESGLSFYDRIRGCMKSEITIMPGVDLTEPADPEWAKVYDNN